MADDDTVKISSKKLKYWGIAIAILIVGSYVYSQRGGTFLVYACNDYTDNCYTLKANLSNKIHGIPKATLFFKNGGSLTIECSDDFGCQDDDGNTWTIKEIERR